MIGLRYPAILFITALLVLSAAVCVAEDISKTKKSDKFVDLDGDGIRDDAADSDGDGIPDFNRKEEPQELQESPELAGLISFGEAGQNFETTSVQTKRENYKLRKFSCRAHTGCRGEFGAGSIGPGQGVSGSVSGACAGGLCF